MNAIESFSLSDMEMVESEVEGGLVGRPMASSRKCDFFHLCGRCSDAEESIGFSIVARIFAIATILVHSQERWQHNKQAEVRKMILGVSKGNS